VYAQAANDMSGIKCRADRTASCLRKASNIDFWYVIRDCPQGYCWATVYPQVAKWKDNVLCGMRKQPNIVIPTQRSTSTPPITSRATSLQIITYEGYGTTKYITMSR
jgi:hypothetical protein